MKQNFNNDAERVAALKRSRLLITAILIITAAAMAVLAYKTFM